MCKIIAAYNQKNYANIFERYMISDLDNELCENMDFNNIACDWNPQTDK